nr:hypothetical protein [Tanacetum cinerariifolium]
MTTLADKAILLGADNRPPMLEKDMYDSWKRKMELYMLNRQHGRMILEFVENGPLFWPTVEENGVTRPKKYSELSATETIQADCDLKEKNIILQGLPPEVYAFVSNHKGAKELWERIQLLMQATSLTKQERECKLYDEFDKFTYKKGESLRDFYLRFSLLLNDMNIYNMKLEQFQVNTKFLNTLPPEWSKFVTDVKLYASQAQASPPLSITYPSNNFQLSVYHNVYNPSSSIPQVEYAPLFHQQSDFHNPILENKGLLFVKTVRKKDIFTNNGAYQADDLDAYDSDCDEVNSAKIVLMMNLSHYGSDNLAKNSSFPAQQDDLILTVIEQLQTQVVNCTKINQDNKNVNEILTAELKRYKDQKEESRNIDRELALEKQVELSAEQAFWSQNSRNSEEPNLSTRTTIVEVPKELPKVSMVNSSLKKLKFHLACFRDEIIPYVKALKDLFNLFDQFLIDELIDVQNVFNKMEQTVKQHCVGKNKFQDKMKDVLKESERLLEQAINIDIVNIVVNANVNYAWVFNLDHSYEPCVLMDSFSFCCKFQVCIMYKIDKDRDRSPRVIILNQSKYALESLKKYGMETCNPVDTPMVKKCKLDEDPQGKAIDLTSSIPDLSRGKGSQGKKTADVFQETVNVSKESEHEPAKKKTDTMQAIKNSQEIFSRQYTAGGLSEGIGSKPGVPDESMAIFPCSNKGTGDKPGVPNEEMNLEDDVERKTAEKDKGDEGPAINVAVILKEIPGIPTTNSRQSKHTVDLFKQHFVKQALESRKTQIPTIDLDQKPKKIMSKIHKIKKEQPEKQKLLKYTIKSTDKAGLKKYDQKSTLYQTTHENKTFNRNSANYALYHDLIDALIMDEEAMDKGVVASVKHHKRQHDDEDDDEDPSARPNQGKMTKRRRTKDSDSSKKPSTTKETSKGKAPTKSSKTGKSATEKEPFEEPIAEVVMDDLESTANEDVVNVAHQPQDDVAPKTMRPSKDTWFKQPPTLPTPDPEWNTIEVVDNAPKEQWFNFLLSAEKEPLTFDTLMATPIDFSKFIMHRLKIDKLTRAHLVSHVYQLLKGTGEGSVKLEYNMKECFNAMTDKLDWNNPEGGQYPFDLTKPLPLKEKVYTTSIMKPKAVRYDLVGIKDMIPKKWSMSMLNITKMLRVELSIGKLYGYGYLKEVVVRRANRQLYTFKEGDFVDLHLNTIKYMLLFAVQHKLFQLEGSDIVDFIMALRMFTRILIFKRRVKDIQVGVESYQKKLNLTRPQKTYPRIKAKELFTPSVLPGIIYEDRDKQKRIMRADELYKFSNRTLKHVRYELHHRVQDFKLGYNKEIPKRKWSKMDRRRLGLIVELIDKQMHEREIIWNLQRLVGARKLKMDYRLMTHTN